MQAILHALSSSEFWQNPRRKRRSRNRSQTQLPPTMQRFLRAPRRILRLRRGTGKSSRVADESSINGNREFDGYNHREGEAWHGAPVSVLVAVLRIPLIAVSCLCQAGGDELRVSTELPMSADEINHLMVYDSRPYAIYV